MCSTPSPGAWCHGSTDGGRPSKDLNHRAWTGTEKNNIEKERKMRLGGNIQPVGLFLWPLDFSKRCWELDFSSREILQKRSRHFKLRPRSPALSTVGQKLVAWGTSGEGLEEYNVCILFLHAWIVDDCCIDMQTDPSLYLSYYTSYCTSCCSYSQTLAMLAAVSPSVDWIPSFGLGHLTITGGREDNKASQRCFTCVGFG